MSPEVVASIITVIGGIAGVYLTNYLTKKDVKPQAEEPLKKDLPIEVKIDRPKEPETVVHQPILPQAGIIWRTLFDDSTFSPYKMYVQKNAPWLAWLGIPISSAMIVALFFLVGFTAPERHNETDPDLGVLLTYRLSCSVAAAVSIIFSFSYYLILRANAKYRNVFPVVLSFPFLLLWIASSLFCLYYFITGSDL
jgi:H+/gluconate symporter-like permease